MGIQNGINSGKQGNLKQGFITQSKIALATKSGGAAPCDLKNHETLSSFNTKTWLSSVFSKSFVSF